MNNYGRRCRLIAVAIIALVVVFSMSAGAQTVTPAQNNSPFWAQWGLNPQHTLDLQTVGQPLNSNLVNIIYDFNVAQEQADPNNTGDLLVHYQVPLVDGNGDVFVESKAGTYSNNTYSTQTWHQNKYSWTNGHFVKVWTFDSDWFAPGSSNDFWEPVYHAVLANGFLYDPGKGGTIFKINKTDGSVVKRINPFGTTVNPNTYTASPLSTDGKGNIFYNVVQIATDPTVSFYTKDVVNSWLVKVGPDDSISMVSYGTLFKQAVIKGVPAGEPLVPKPNDNCKAAFSSAQLPWPPSPDAQPPTINCGSQRAALNIAPAIAPDGTIYTISRAHVASRYNYLVAVNPNLTGKWAASFRGRLNDGCGVDLFNFNPGGAGANGGCRDGSHVGVDPGTNEPPPARVLDDSSSTPTIAPDGSIFYGAYTAYNWAQGHLMHFSANGDFLNAFNFGWDSTPAIVPHNGTYSVVIKNNHYAGGSYCIDPNWCPAARTADQPMGKESFFISSLTPSLAIEWSFQATNTQSCTRNSDGSLTCVSDHPNGFEWCVNAPVVDANGTAYANSEDGNLYAINPGGTFRQSIFQQLALGAAYTPVSLDQKGRFYSQNAGHLFVVGED